VRSTREQFSTQFDLPVIGKNAVQVVLASVACHEILQRHYRAAFPNLEMAKIWQGDQLYDPKRQNTQSMHIAYVLTLHEGLTTSRKAANAT